MDIDGLFILVPLTLGCIVIIINIVIFFSNKEISLTAKIVISIIIVVLGIIVGCLNDYYEGQGYTRGMESRFKTYELFFCISFPSSLVAYIIYKIYLYNLKKKGYGNDDYNKED